MKMRARSLALIAAVLTVGLAGCAGSPLRRGNAAMLEGNTADALDSYSEAVEEDTGWQAYVARGMAYEKAGKTAEALADYEKAIEANPGATWAYLHRGRIRLHTAADASGAILDAQKAVDLAPGLSAGWALLGEALHSGRDFEAAASAYGKAADSARDADRASRWRANAAVCLMRASRHEEAADQYERALSEAPAGRPTDGQIFTMGLLCYRAGEMSRASQWWDRLPTGQRAHVEAVLAGSPSALAAVELNKGRRKQ